MEKMLSMYHFQAGNDPYSKGKDASGWLPSSSIDDIMEAYKEYTEDKEEN